MLKPTAAELEILQILWKSEPETVKFVNDQINLSDSKSVGYTTTLKLMQNLFDKKFVSREKKSKSHIYSTIIDKEKVQNDLLDRFLHNTFSGSAKNLVMSALGKDTTTKAEIDEIKNFLNQIEQDRGE